MILYYSITYYTSIILHYSMSCDYITVDYTLLYSTILYYNSNSNSNSNYNYDYDYDYDYN